MAVTKQEIERKFLVKYLPAQIKFCPKVEIVQGYLQRGQNEIRVRSVDGDKFYITQKSGYGLKRQETEEELTAEEFNSMLKYCFGRVITKSRTKIRLKNGLVAELDIYSGKLDGLQVVEVEFTSAMQAMNFVAPCWFGVDVTHNPAYKNANLAEAKCPPALGDI